MDESFVETHLDPEHELPSPTASQMAQEKPRHSFLLIGVLVAVIVLISMAAAYVIGFGAGKQQIAVLPSVEPVAILPSPVIATPAPVDPTANWKIFTNEKFTFKYPEYFSDFSARKKNYGEESAPDTFETTYLDPAQKGGGSGYTLSLKVVGPEKIPGTMTVEQWINNEGLNSEGYGNTFQRTLTKRIIDGKEFSYQTGKSSNFPAPTEFNLYLLINDYVYTLHLDEQTNENGSLTYAQLMDQILSTFKFISTQPVASPVVTSGGAKLADIKYTLPSAWQGSIQNNTLLLSASGGGYLSVTVSSYAGQGRRELYCQLKNVCTAQSVFTSTQIGNISGYRASALDNSGGGDEYFGAKGDKFYIISTYNPPSPNEFEKNYKKVLSSLVF